MKKLFVSPALHSLLPIAVLNELYSLMSILPATNKIHYFTLHMSLAGTTIEHSIPTAGFKYQIIASELTFAEEEIKIVAVDHGNIINMALLCETQ